MRIEEVSPPVKFDLWYTDVLNSFSGRVISTSRKASGLLFSFVPDIIHMYSEYSRYMFTIADVNGEPIVYPSSCCYMPDFSWKNLVYAERHHFHHVIYRNASTISKVMGIWFQSISNCRQSLIYRNRRSESSYPSLLSEWCRYELLGSFSIISK